MVTHEEGLRFQTFVRNEAEVWRAVRPRDLARQVWMKGEEVHKSKRIGANRAFDIKKVDGSREHCEVTELYWRRSFSFMGASPNA